MLKSLYPLLTYLMLVVLMFGCSGGSDPVTPPDPISPAITSDPGTNERSLLFYNHVSFDPATCTAEIIPSRDISTHFNVLNWLEVHPCTDCFQITGITPGDNGSVLFDIQIRHPLDNYYYTMFDVRGVVMFDGSGYFPEADLVWSDRSLGDGQVLNPDGYTTLYNSSTEGSGPDGIQGYIQGVLASDDAPNATLNAYKRFISPDDPLDRNALYGGDTVTVTYEIAMPDQPVVFGYAVDGNWRKPLHFPLEDPPYLFMSGASCPEAWQVYTSDAGPGLLPGTGSGTTLWIKIFDHQGPDETYPLLVECPDLFDGTVEAEFHSNSAGYDIFTAQIYNSKLAGAGSYPLLISKESGDNDPVNKPWLDLTAYSIFMVNVADNQSGSLVTAKSANGNGFDFVNGSVILSDDSFAIAGEFGSTDLVGADITFGEGEANEITLDAVESSYNTRADIFVARYNPDCTLMWARRDGAEGRDEAHDITALSDNSVVVTGVFGADCISNTYPTTFGEGEPNEVTFTPYGDLDQTDMFVARYNPDGTLAWARANGGPNYEDNLQAVTLSDDSIVIVGHSEGWSVYDQDGPNETYMSSNMFMLRYDPDGNLMFARRIGGYALLPRGMIALPDDSIIVTGIFGIAQNFGCGDDNDILITPDETDPFIARYDSEGNLLWVEMITGSEIDTVRGICALSDNSVVLTGSFMKYLRFGSGADHIVLHAVESDFEFCTGIWIARYTADGDFVWAKSADGVGEDEGQALASLSDDSVILTGYVEGWPTFGKGEPGEVELGDPYIKDAFVAQYNSDGTLNWVRRVYGGNHSIGRTICVLSDDSPIVSGQYAGTPIFGRDEPNETMLESVSNLAEIFVARYNQ